MKYQFAIMFDEMDCDLERKVKDNKGLSNIFSNYDQKCKYSYVIFATKEAKEFFCNEYLELLNYTKSRVVALSLFPRYISTLEFERIISQTDDDILKEQLETYIQAKLLVEGVLNHLNITASDLSKMLGCNSQDINSWLSLNSKPDSFKQEILKYIISIKETKNNHFINYLKTKISNLFYRVEVLNEHTNMIIPPYSRNFDNLDNADAYVKSLSTRGYFDNSEIVIQIVDVKIGSLVSKIKC